MWKPLTGGLGMKLSGMRCSEVMLQSVDPRPHCSALGYRRWVTRRSEHLSQELHEYAEAHSTRPEAVLRDLAAETAARFGHDAGMQIGPDQGTFMTLLARLTRAASAVEVGTFTGYSAICIARGLADGGRLLCCDVSEEWTSVAREYWKQAGRAHPGRQHALTRPGRRPAEPGRFGAGHQALQRPRAGGRPGRPRAAADRRRPDAGAQALIGRVSGTGRGGGRRVRCCAVRWPCPWPAAGRSRRAATQAVLRRARPRCWPGPPAGSRPARR